MFFSNYFDDSNKFARLITNIRDSNVHQEMTAYYVTTCPHCEYGVWINHSHWKQNRTSTLPFLGVAVNRKPHGSFWHRVYRTAMHSHLIAIFLFSKSDITKMLQPFDTHMTGKCYIWNVVYIPDTRWNNPASQNDLQANWLQNNKYSMRLSTQDVSHIHDRVASMWNVDHLWQYEHASGRTTQNWCTFQPKRMSHHHDEV